MDDPANLLVDIVPNLAALLYVIWRDGRMIEKLLETQKWMVEQLMALHPPQDEQKASQDVSPPP